MEAQIIKALKMQEVQSKKVSEICRDLGISEPTFHNWKSRYGGMGLPELTRAKVKQKPNDRYMVSLNVKAA